MKNLLLLIVLALPNRSNAQDFQGEAQKIVDSMLGLSGMDNAMAWALELQEPDAVRLFDSVQRALVEQRVLRLTSKDRYTWPGWYLPKHCKNDSNANSTNQQLTETARYLPESKYHISMNGVSNGCVWQEAFVLHDSLMAEAIRKRYGADFFAAYQKEAADLDKRSEGLILPYIKAPSQTAATLDSVFGWIKILDSEKGAAGKSRFLMFDFQNGQVIDVSICERMFYIQQDFSLMAESKRLIPVARLLAWTPPKFKNKPVAATIIYDMQDGSLSFYRGGSFF